MLAIPTRPMPKGLQRSANKGGFSPCVVCGCGVNTESKTAKMLHVHMGGGTEVEAESLNAGDWRGGDLGMQYVGPDCLRRYPELRPYVTNVRLR